MTGDPYREDPGFSFGELEATGTPLPVRRIEVHVRVSGVHAHVTLEQTYVNARDALLEVSYLFPLPALGAVSSYAFTVDGTTTRGTLHEREEARAIYDRAIAAGHGASTLEEDRPEVMTVRVGNLAPGSTARVQLGIDLILPVVDDCVVLRIPLLVGARYVPGQPLAGRASGDGTAPDTEDAPDASRVTPPLAVDDPGLRVGLIIEAFGAADALATHPLDLEHRADRLRARIRDTLPDGDIVVRFPLAARDAALFCPDPRGDRGTLVVTSWSALPPSVRPLDVAVLLDRSGSMEGAKLALARRAAMGIVEGLTSRDRVLPIVFDHLVDAPLGSELVRATGTQRRRALAMLGGVEAAGGTELATPLQLATRAFAELRDDPERPRRRAIVLITDGQVANEDQLVAIAARGGVEILTVAIGAAANEGLCQRLASITGGACEAAAASELVSGALDRTLRRLLAPALEDLELAVDGAVLAPGSRAPARPPRAIPGVPTTIAARVISATGAWTTASLPSRVVLRAIDPQGASIRRELPVEVVDLPALRRVWARLRIRDLEDQLTAARFPAGVALEDELVATSLEHGVLCRYTAFVAVDPALRDRTRERARMVQPVMAVERSLAEPAATKTRAGSLRGKLAYLSPEQAKGLAVEAATDVFTLAVIVHELATRERLFRGDSDLAGLTMIVNDPPPPLPAAFAPLQPILARALAKAPAARYRDAGELAAELARLPADRTGLAELATRLYRPPATPGPVAARARAWWITERLSFGWADTLYAAAYAGPLADAWPDVIVRVPRDLAEAPLRDPLAIDHPNIARMFGVLAHPERTQVIERIPGVDLVVLLHALSTGVAPPLSLGQVVAIAQDLAAAVAAIHARGVVHRDLRPGSFVLSTRGSCVLVTHAGAVAGTPLPVLPIPLRGLGTLIA